MTEECRPKQCDRQVQSPPNSLFELAEHLKRTNERESSRSRTHGQTILITGVSSGIGLDAAKLFALVNPVNRLILVARTMEKALYAKEQVEKTLMDHHETIRERNCESNNPSSCSRLLDWSENLIPLACDNTSLTSVKDFNVSLRKKLRETYRGHKWALNGIDVMCLNAAILTAKDSAPQFTEDGYELTFQTNHLAHFLLASLTNDLLNPGSRVVVTTSGLYNWEKLNTLNGIESLVAKTKRKRKQQHRLMEQDNVVISNMDFQNTPNTDTEGTNHYTSSPSPSPSPTDDSSSSSASSSITPNNAMIDGSEFHFKRSYAFSKLCNVAFCAEMNHRLQQRNDDSFAVSFSPGLMPKTGLFRNQQPINNSWHDNPDILKKQKSVLWGAGALVFVAIADEVAEQDLSKVQYWSDTHSLEASNAAYGKEFICSFVSEEELSIDEREKMWKLSNELVNIQEESL